MKIQKKKTIKAKLEKNKRAKQNGSFLIQSLL